MIRSECSSPTGWHLDLSLSELPLPAPWMWVDRLAPLGLLVVVQPILQSQNGIIEPANKMRDDYFKKKVLFFSLIWLF